MNIATAWPLLLALTLGLYLLEFPTPVEAAPKKLLVVTVTKGFVHSSIPTAEKVLGELAQKSGDFTVDFVRINADMAEKMTAARQAVAVALGKPERINRVERNQV